MGLKVAIVGMAPSKSLVPDEGWERWGLAYDPDCLRFDRAFEMHDDFTEVDRLSMFPVLYMQDTFLPNATRYPFEEVSATCGAYWESSVAYMLALAVHEQAEEIALYGIDMDAGTEYAYQRPNMEYLIGLARGKGIKVHVLESSPLCKFSKCFGYPNRYGSHL